MRKILATSSLALLALGVAPATQAAITDDLVVHLTFDNTFNDASGRNNNGTPVVQPEFEASGLPVTVTDGSLIGSHALRLTTGQHVTLGQPSDLMFGATTDFSIAFWIRGNPGAWTSDPSFIANKAWQSGGNRGYIIAAQGNGGWKWNFTASDAGRRDTPNLGVITDGAWHHIVVTHKRDGMALFYVDAVKVDENEIANQGDIDSPLDINIGNDGTGRYGFDNDLAARFSQIWMDDVAFWRREISEEEIAIIYGAGLQGKNLAEADAVPFVASRLFPADGSTQGPAVGVVFVEFTNIASQVDPESVVFFFNNEAVAATVTTEGDVTRVAYTLPEPLSAGSSHTVRVEAADSSATPTTLVQEWSYTVADFTTVNQDFGLPAGSGNTPGIRFLTHWSADVAGNLPTTIARAEAQLAGELFDQFGIPVFNAATAGPLAGGFYNVPVVNFEQWGESIGRIPGDTPFPGIDAPADYNNFATEALAFLDLKAGYYRFGVNSDDGFQLRVGLPARSVVNSQVLGFFDGGRGSADSIFDFVILEDGIYPFRLIHFEGTGGANLEWWHVDLETGDRILINDPQDPRAIRSFVFANASDSLAFVRRVSPAPGIDSARVDDPITLTIVDGTVAVPQGSVQLSLNGNSVNATVTQDGTGLTSVSYTPVPALSYNTDYEATITFGTGAAQVSNTWSFRTRGFDQPRGITGHWNFEGGLGALVGRDIEYPNQTTRDITQFGTTEDFGIPGIGGQAAPVMYFPGAANPNLYFTVHHGAAPNGNGILVNQYTLIYDLFFPETNTGAWFSFAQIDDLTNANDGELFINFSDRTGDDIADGGIGIGGQYTADDGTTYIRRGQWHRVVFAIDQTSDNEYNGINQGVLSKFIDGVKFQDQGRGETFDGRHALRDRFLLFADENGESQPVYISSLQVRNYKMSDAEIAALGGVSSAAGIPTVSGQWNFTSGNLDATIGTPMAFLGNTETVTTFDTDTIAGQTANVMRFPAATSSQGYFVMPGLLPNGGGDHANVFTLLMDIKFPESSNNSWRGLWQTDTNNANDGEYFINTANGIGISGQYHGTIAPDAWHRVAFALDLTKSELAKYIDGELVGTQSLTGIDGRWSVGEAGLLFTDNDGETAAGIVGSVQFRPFQLSAEQIAALGGATASGIPLDLPYIEVEAGVPDVEVALNPDGSITLTWEAGQGLILEHTESLANPDWQPVAGVTGNSATVPAGDAAGFFRLRR